MEKSCAFIIGYWCSNKVYASEVLWPTVTVPCLLLQYPGVISPVVRDGRSPAPYGVGSRIEGREKGREGQREEERGKEGGRKRKKRERVRES